MRYDKTTNKTIKLSKLTVFTRNYYTISRNVIIRNKDYNNVIIVYNISIYI